METYEWPEYNRYHSTERALRDEIARLNKRIDQLEGVKASLYEIRLFVNDRWKSTYKASDKIKLVEHTYLGSDRTLYKRH